MESLSEEAETCSNQGNQYPFCSPTFEETWKNGTTHNFVWNYNYPYYVSTDYLSLYLYYYIKFEYIFVKKFTSISTSTGGLTVTVDDSWFLSPSTKEQNLTLYGYYLPSDVNSTQELTNINSMYPRPFNFTVTQFVSNNNNSSNNNTITTTTTTAATTTTTTTTTAEIDANKNSSTSGGHLDLPAWSIAIIVISILALLCGIGAIVWTMTLSRTKQQKVPEKPGPKHIYPDDTMNSQARLLALRSNDSVPSTENSVQTCVVPPEPSKLSQANHNIMFLTDTLRQSLHSHDEEQRRKLGQALLQKQLEQEGTLVKHAGHRVVYEKY